MVVELTLAINTHCARTLEAEINIGLFFCAQQKIIGPNAQVNVILLLPVGPRRCGVRVIVFVRRLMAPLITGTARGGFLEKR